MVIKSKSDSLFFGVNNFSKLEKHTKGTFNTCSFHLAWTEVIECVYLVYKRERGDLLRLDWRDKNAVQNTYFMWGYIA